MPSQHGLVPLHLPVARWLPDYSQAKAFSEQIAHISDTSRSQRVIEKHSAHPIRILWLSFFLRRDGLMF